MRKVVLCLLPLMVWLSLCCSRSKSAANHGDASNPSVQRLYGNNRVRFVRADLTTDRLPAADVGIVRQVLQHLSNAEVQMVLENVRHTYPIAFITEHVYVGRGCKPNLDITHGPGTRVPWRSGVFIDQPPFNLPAALVADVQYAADEVLRTWVVEGTFNESRSSRHPIA